MEELLLYGAQFAGLLQNPVSNGVAAAVRCFVPNTRFTADVVPDVVHRSGRELPRAIAVGTCGQEKHPAVEMSGIAGAFVLQVVPDGLKRFSSNFYLPPGFAFLDQVRLCVVKINVIQAEAGQRRSPHARPQNRIDDRPVAIRAIAFPLWFRIPLSVAVPVPGEAACQGETIGRIEYCDLFLFCKSAMHIEQGSL